MGRVWAWPWKFACLLFLPSPGTTIELYLGCNCWLGLPPTQRRKGWLEPLSHCSSGCRRWAVSSIDLEGGKESEYSTSDIIITSKCLAGRHFPEEDSLALSCGLFFLCFFLPSTYLLLAALVPVLWASKERRGFTGKEHPLLMFVTECFELGRPCYLSQGRDHMLFSSFQSITIFILLQELWTAALVSALLCPLWTKGQIVFLNPTSL